MEKQITQWVVTVDGKEMAMFTPLSCQPEMAMAIAVATFGPGITGLESEGMIRQYITDGQLAMVSA
jgi:hypothetical protein